MVKPSSTTMKKTNSNALKLEKNNKKTLLLKNKQKKLEGRESAFTVESIALAAVLLQSPGSNDPVCLQFISTPLEGFPHSAKWKQLLHQY
jgi:hypothetical protein